MCSGTRVYRFDPGFFYVLEKNSIILIMLEVLASIRHIFLQMTRCLCRISKTQMYIILLRRSNGDLGKGTSSLYIVYHFLLLENVKKKKNIINKYYLSIKNKGGTRSGQPTTGFQDNMYNLEN